MKNMNGKKRKQHLLHLNMIVIEIVIMGGKSKAPAKKDPAAEAEKAAAKAAKAREKALADFIKAAKQGRLHQMLFFSAPLTIRTTTLERLPNEP